jgi:hypothetical protein
VVLDGFELRSDVKIIMPGERYHDERGQGFFERVVGLLDETPS